MGFIRNPKDVLSGLLFIVIAAIFAWQGFELPMGTAVRMGPGYFPMLLSGLLALIGVIVTINGLRFDGEAPGGVAWRAFFILIGIVLFFGFSVRPLGFLPAIAILVFVSAMASRKFHLATAIISALVITLFSWLVFIKGLGLPLQVVGPWLGGY